MSSSYVYIYKEEANKKDDNAVLKSWDVYVLVCPETGYAHRVYCIKMI